jgi:hypothetical protein
MMPAFEHQGSGARVGGSDLWIIIAIAVVGFIVVKAVNSSNRKTEKRVVSATLDVLVGPITPRLILGAGIPLRPNTSISEPYAGSLARHVKIYLKQNPDEAARYIELIKGEDTPEELLGYEIMLEHSQYIRTIILRAILYIKQKGNWEFCSAIDESRLSRLVHSLQSNPESYHLMSDRSNTLMQDR